MKEVQAVKATNDIATISTLLKKHSGEQFSQIWDLGINVALRISDLLSVKFTDIKNDTLHIIESKTNKSTEIHLNAKAMQIIASIKKANPSDVYLFQSHGRNVKKIKPLTRQSVGQAFNAVGDIVGIDLSTHSMRKTRGYHMYKKTNDIARVMKMLRHSSAAITLRYIGIDQDQVNQDFAELEL